MTKTLSISSKKEKDRILCREVKGQQREGFLIKINITTINHQNHYNHRNCTSPRRTRHQMFEQVLGYCFKGEQTTSKQVASQATYLLAPQAL